VTRDAARARIEAVGIIPSLRLSSADDARFAAETVAAAGIPIVEVTMTVPGALSAIDDLATAMPDLVVGAGTVLDAATARRCLEAGARFITSPGFDLHVVEYAVGHEVLVLPGVLSPTDIMAALHARADLVKVFPCAALGGPQYLKALSAPFPLTQFVAAGGVNQRTAGEYITAGAVAVGIGAELVPKKAVQDRDRRWVTELAHRFLGIVQAARSLAREPDSARR
jgi:2-dehydro-3-deoxyphosphogluconate aldolase/(4S)-4-hydroxy-2-oxoglutarate aldolase